jgi:hypothetical protein
MQYLAVKMAVRGFGQATENRSEASEKNQTCSSDVVSEGVTYFPGPQKTCSQQPTLEGDASLARKVKRFRYKCGELKKTLGEVCYVPDGYAVSILIGLNPTTLSPAAK